ncbi:Orn/Lys/Arg family decarboxylase [Escherichia coli]
MRIRDAEGRIAAEGALPYPPGVLCVVPGKSGWGGSTLFPCTGRRGDLLPGFCRSCKVFIAKPMRMA